MPKWICMLDLMNLKWCGFVFDSNDRMTYNLGLAILPRANINSCRKGQREKRKLKPNGYLKKPLKAIQLKWNLMRCKYPKWRLILVKIFLLLIEIETVKWNTIDHCTNQRDCISGNDTRINSARLSPMHWWSFVRYFSSDSNKRNRNYASQMQMKKKKIAARWHSWAIFNAFVFINMS